MSLRIKTILLIGLTTAGMIAALLGVSQFILLRSFAEVENSQVVQNVDRVESILADDAETLGSKVGDWAVWDDTYQFVQDGNKDYIESNLPDTTFSELRLNVMLFIQPTGKVVFAKGFDLEKEKAVPVSLELLRQLSGGSELLSAASNGTRRKGFLIVAGQPMLLVVSPILTSEGEGPSKGALVAGYYVNEAELKRIERKAHLSVLLERNDNIAEARSTSASAKVIVLSDRTIQGSEVIRDIFGKNSLTLKVRGPRPVNEQGKHTLEYLIVSALASAALFGIVIIALLQRVILRRVARLDEGITRVGGSSDLGLRLEIEGDDELADLAIAINRTLAALENSQSNLSESEEKFRSISESAQDAIVMFDSEGVVSYWNRAGEQIFGHRPEEAIGKNLYDLIIPEELKQHYRDEFARLNEPGSLHTIGKTIETSALRDDGKQFPVEVSLSSVVIEGSWRSIGIFRDISERAAMKVIRHMASHDSLTDLPNRVLLSDRIGQVSALSFRNSSQAALLHLDLDHFKDVNDVFGHPFGDELLKSVAQRLVNGLRGSDTIARLGADEFVIVAPSIGEVRAGILAEKIISVVSEPYEIQGHTVHTSPSIGIVIFPGDGENGLSPDELLQRADVAMYEAKRDGRKTFKFYDEGMTARVTKRLAILNDLGRACEAKEFILHYQPQVDLVTGKIIAVEALVRWMHPERGLVPPFDFIPIAEASGAIIQIGDWVLMEACRQVKEWQDAGLPELRVSVNVSSVQIARADVPAAVKHALDASGIDPQTLDLEITESVLMEVNTEQTFDQLRKLGVRLSIDDFGTGYSSLSYLRRFRFDTLKIDRSFVTNVDSNADAGMIFEGIVGLGHNLGMNVLAEGAETEGEVSFVKSRGCDEMQGYFVSRPLPADQLSEFVTAEYAATQISDLSSDSVGADPVLA